MAASTKSCHLKQNYTKFPFETVSFIYLVLILFPPNSSSDESPEPLQEISPPKWLHSEPITTHEYYCALCRFPLLQDTRRERRCSAPYGDTQPATSRRMPSVNREPEPISTCSGSFPSRKRKNLSKGKMV